MSFSVTGARVDVVLFYFVYPLAEAEPQDWVVDTAGHEGGYTHRVAWGTWPPLATNFVNNTRNSQAEKSAFSIIQ